MNDENEIPWSLTHLLPTVCRVNAYVLEVLACFHTCSAMMFKMFFRENL